MSIRCTVKSIESLASNTYKIIIHPENKVEFKAGQYLLVVMGESDKRPFSIASSPCRHNGELELHIGAAEQNPYALEVVEKLKLAAKSGDFVEIEAPHGDAWLQESQRPILLIAGGTGFSYVRSILDHCISQSLDVPVYLYWGAKDADQLYAMEELLTIESENSNIHFVPVVENSDNHWSGKVGNVLQAVEEDFSTLSEFDIYIAGRFEMAGAARERFTANKHATPEHMYADAYAFI
jgi:aquacobalamin reductase/NAD(P)H-flavin reductase